MAMSAGQLLVETKDLTKHYGELVAVDKLNLRVERGTIFGLLGPNGAGKTTTILMLLGLTEPTAGKALINGLDPTRNPLQVKSIVGYLPDNGGFYQDMTGEANLRYTCELNGLSPGEAEKRIMSALERVGLKNDAHRKVSEYSRGMRQRLGIADLLVKDPPLIIMDEPTLGIDPKGVRELLQLIRELVEEDNRTILLASHLLHQVQEVCDKVGIFVKGKMIASGTIDSLGSQLGSKEKVRLEVCAEPLDEALINLCRDTDGVLGVKQEGRMLIIRSKKDIRSSLAAKIVAGGYNLLHLRQSEFSLDDIYQRYFQEKEGEYEEDGASEDKSARA